MAPPVQQRFCPLTNDDKSPAKYSAASATSSAVPMRPIGILFFTNARTIDCRRIDAVYGYPPTSQFQSQNAYQVPRPDLTASVKPDSRQWKIGGRRADVDDPAVVGYRLAACCIVKNAPFTWTP
jgi:hypothetical protein